MTSVSDDRAQSGIRRWRRPVARSVPKSPPFSPRPSTLDDLGCITCPLLSSLFSCPSITPGANDGGETSIVVGELRWGSVLRGVWEGILIQHATHDVGPTMTAPIPALIFHRFYSRLSPSPLVHPTSHLPAWPLLPSGFFYIAPSLPVPLSLSLSPSRTTVVSPGYSAAPPGLYHSCHDTEPSFLPPRRNPIFYTVKPVCLSSRPRLISSFQNRNVMDRRE